MSYVVTYIFSSTFYFIIHNQYSSLSEKYTYFAILFRVVILREKRVRLLLNYYFRNAKHSVNFVKYTMEF